MLLVGWHPVHLVGTKKIAMLNYKQALHFIKLFVFLLGAFFTPKLAAQCPLNTGETTLAPTNGLILYLPLDGNTANSGTGNYTINLAGARFVDGICGNGLEFDGIDDYLEVLPSVDLRNDFTITAWIKAKDMLRPMDIFSVREQCVSSYRGFAMIQLGLNEYQVSGLSSQVNTTVDCVGGSAGDRYRNSEIAIPNDEYTFIAVTVENNSSENRQVSLTVNCTEYETEMTIDYPTDAVFSGLINFCTTIGAASKIPGYINSFSGIIDEFRLYDRTLGYDEIQKIYRNCRPLTLSHTQFTNCASDSLLFQIDYSETDVDYAVMNMTNNLLITTLQSGNCGVLLLHSGMIDDTANIQVIATHRTSGCITLLDSPVSVVPRRNFHVWDVNQLCEGDSIWFQGQFISIPGHYTDTVPQQGQCDSIYELDITAVPTVQLNLVSDTTICEGDHLILDVTVPEATYFWQDHSSMPVFEVTTTGDYWVEVSTLCGTSSDSSHIDVIDCDCNYFLPNAFTPNGDQLNDDFGLITDCAVINDFHLLIFNRFGSMMFESTDVRATWDGSYRGKKCPAGSYVWILFQKDHFNQAMKPQKGLVSLVY